MEINPIVAAKAIAVWLASTWIVAYKVFWKWTFWVAMLWLGTILWVALSEAKILADKNASNSYNGRRSPGSGVRPQSPEWYHPWMWRTTHPTIDDLGMNRPGCPSWLPHSNNRDTPQCRRFWPGSPNSRSDKMPNAPTPRERP